jgi:hypothetical protein
VYLTRLRLVGEWRRAKFVTHQVEMTGTRLTTPVNEAENPLNALCSEQDSSYNNTRIYNRMRASRTLL